jgi:hypothetical protein
VIELAEIFRQHGPAYREKFKGRIPASHLKVMAAIEQCRTEALGGQVYTCEDCGQTRYSYHSCKNRHCPKCQNDAGQQWLARQTELLLPVPYFMVTFTLPEELRALARSNQRFVYDVLFQASAAALQALAHDPRFVGGQLAFVGVLQTRTGELTYHPHVRYLVPGQRHRLQQARQLLGAAIPPAAQPAQVQSPLTFPAHSPPIPCPTCGRPMRLAQTLRPQRCRSP